VISRLITDAGSAGDHGVHLANRLHNHLGCAHPHSNPPSQILRRYVPSDGIEMLVEWGATIARGLLPSVRRTA
jgi:hypothetical protein